MTNGSKSISLDVARFRFDGLGGILPRSATVGNRTGLGIVTG